MFSGSQLCHLRLCQWPFAEQARCFSMFKKQKVGGFVEGVIFNGFYQGINHHLSPLFGRLVLTLFQALWPCKSKMIYRLMEEILPQTTWEPGCIHWLIKISHHESLSSDQFIPQFRYDWMSWTSHETKTSRNIRTFPTTSRANCQFP